MLGFFLISLGDVLEVFLSFPFAFLCALLLLVLSVHLGQFILLPLHLVRFLFLLRVLPGLFPFLLLPVQDRLHVSVLEQGCGSPVKETPGERSARNSDCGYMVGPDRIKP